MAYHYNPTHNLQTAMNAQLGLMSYNKEVVRFTRSPKGGYYDEDGNRVSVETLMRHSHEINGDEGYYIKDSNNKHEPMNPLDELQKKVEDMTTATHEYTGVTIELVDKNQVLQLIKEAKTSNKT